MSKISKYTFASLSIIAAVALASCSKPAATDTSADTNATAAPAADTNTATSTNTAAATNTTAAPAADAVDPADAKKLASLPAPYNTADLANGKHQFAICQTCHNIAAGAGTKVGPDLHGVLERKAGTLAGFTYSDGFKAAGFQWSLAQLDTYLTNPAKLVPGTKMAFAGIPVEKNRQDVVAYVAVESAK